MPPPASAKDRIELAEALEALYKALREFHNYNDLVEEHLDPIKDALVADGWFDEDLNVE